MFLDPLLDSFWANLLFFVIGQVVAIAYMSTGLVLRGRLLMFGVFLLADVALVARHAYGFSGAAIKVPLLLMWAYALAELGAILYCRTHRRLKSVIEWRDDLFREAYLLYLRDDLDVAVAAYRKLARSDPWDLPVRVAYGTALARQGLGRKARGLFRAARALDKDKVFEDVIEAEIARTKRPADSGTAAT